MAFQPWRNHHSMNHCLDFGEKNSTDSSRAPRSPIRAFKTSMLRKAQQAKSLKMAPGLGLHFTVPNIKAGIWKVLWMEEIRITS